MNGHDVGRCGIASLLRTVPEILEGGENELPYLYGPTLHRLYTRLLALREDIEAMTKEVEALVKQHPICSRLTALEGIGPIGALLLYATMGSGIALANKNVRTAWAMVTQGTEYQRREQLNVAA